MSAVWRSETRDLPGRFAANSPSASPLSTLVYRSRAVEPIPEAALRRLLLDAQARNRAESITGLLIYEDGWFFQWLEGPPDSLSRVWQSIRHDPRHTDIQIVGNALTPVRFFGEWNLKLATRRINVREGLPPEAVAASAQIIDLFYRQTIRPEAWAPDDARNDLLRNLVTKVAIPHLVTRYAMAPLPQPHARIAELAGLLIAADPTEAFDLVSGLVASANSLGAAFASVLEPSARRLGDLWNSDDCSDVDVTIGMCRLQTALRRTSVGRPALAAPLPFPGVVLVAPQPGEIHMLGSTLDAELLWRAGWNTHCEYPATDQALQDLLAATWFDALDLSMSLALQHEHRLDLMAQTILHAREASRNPDLRIVVGGRVFFERAGAGTQIGADASAASAMQVTALMLKPPVAAV